MLDSDLVDGIAAAGLLLFTSGEVGATDSVIEIISKFGVIAVLWYWLRDMKSQMKDIHKSNDEDRDELRTHYDKLLEEKNKQLEQKDKTIESLQNKVYEVLEKDKEKAD